MSLSAITKITTSEQGSTGPLFAQPVTMAGDAAYATGGSAGFQTAVRTLFGDQRTIVCVTPVDCGGYTPAFDVSTGKLKVYRNGAINTPMAEVPNATDLSGSTFKMMVWAY